MSFSSFCNDAVQTCYFQEIDGPSLLLLKRSDVLQGLSLRLGPALKIYNHVMKLQTAGNGGMALS